MKNLIKIITVFSILILVIGSTDINAQISVGVSIRVAPPALPVYSQPYCPGDGYMWVPGYWAYGDNGYFWVPGTWVLPPQTGFLWTPGYWSFSGGYYGWHPGYWGRHIGFYGGINYGFGYVGTGYVGGTWSGATFRYNTAVNNINTTVVHNTYINKTVINNNTTIVNNRSSFNGQGGIIATPSQRELQVSREKHLNPTPDQTARETSSRADRNQYASVNNGHPEKSFLGEPKEHQQKNYLHNNFSNPDKRYQTVNPNRDHRMNFQKQQPKHYAGNERGRQGREKNHDRG